MFVGAGTIGESGEILVSTVEIIDLSDNSTKCEPWHQLAIPIRGAVAGFVDGGVLICGGNPEPTHDNVTNQYQHIRPDKSERARGT